MALGLELDPLHESFDIFDDKIIRDIWRDKYALPVEQHPNETFGRVCNAVYAKDKDVMEKGKAYLAIRKGLFMPGGRILAGAGTPGQVTMMNCYVSRTIPDSMEGIFAALGEAAVTLSMYGGIGMNFGTIRPKGAHINRTGLEAPGPITFMKLWNSMSASIMQAGHRRGAMMGVLPVSHPDIHNFIKAKQTAGELTNFNVSVLISDAFMKAVEDNTDWVLSFDVPPSKERPASLSIYDKDDQFAYEVVKARDLWDEIMLSTHEFSEPGVIFIDRINKQNNLQYIEEIMCTNPCGEQPLPPYGTCNLGAVNLALMVRNPYSSEAFFNFGLLEEVVRVGIRFLDNVIDVTHYPLPQQREEEIDKRRLGLGVSGLADALAQLGIPYNSEAAVEITERIMNRIAEQAYISSANLADKRGVFRRYSERSLFGNPNSFVHKLSLATRDYIKEVGLRNGVIMTIAPTGTTSILFGNISSGIEPVFQHYTRRKVWTSNTETKEYISYGFGARFLKHCRPDIVQTLGNRIYDMPYMVTADKVELSYHVKMQAACQKWVDASISKTINCPETISFDDFKQVYMQAYGAGCKGCTTYRPSAMRGSVLEAVVEPDKNARICPKHNISFIASCGLCEAEENAKHTVVQEEPMDTTKKESRPEVLLGATYKVVWPSLEANMYITINEHEGRPYEVFIKSKDLRLIEWTTVISMMISRQLRMGVNPKLISDDFLQIQGAHDGQWKDKKFYSSIIMYIGHILEKHFERYQSIGPRQRTSSGEVSVPANDVNIAFAALGKDLAVEILRVDTNDKVTIPFNVHMACPKCLQQMRKEEGCNKCDNCGYSKCG